MIRVVLFTREGCHLCENAKRDILDVGRRKNVQIAIEEVDIDTDERLRELFDHEVPVIFIEGVERFRYRVDREQLGRFLESTT